MGKYVSVDIFFVVAVDIFFLKNVCAFSEKIHNFAYVSGN